MKNPTLNNYKINALAEQRWSPRAFSNRIVESNKIKSILEAARWAPSAFNEQPWRFIIGQKGNNTYKKILSTLVDWNKLWASNAPVLILNMAKKTFAHNGKQNITFKYDLGQAVGIMILEAVNQGLFTHQMTGFNADTATILFSVPDDYQVVSVTALGYGGNVDDLPKEIAGMETKLRERNSLNKIAFSSIFGESFNL